MNSRDIDTLVAEYRQQLERRAMAMVVEQETLRPVVRVFGDTCCAHNPYCGMCGKHIDQHTLKQYNDSGGGLYLCPPEK